MHLMIDLETLSTLPDAPIIQIGAVWFDPLGRGYGPAIRFDIDPQSSFDLGGVPKWSTIAFWLEQSQRMTRSSLRLVQEGDKHHLADALTDLRDMFEAQRPEGVWSHGAGFDLPILRSAYAALDQQVPWHYRTERCTRTLFALADQIKPGWTEQHPVLTGYEAAHDALDDARVQALKVQAAMEVLL